jgi:hypothetical protein
MPDVHRTLATSFIYTAMMVLAPVTLAWSCASTASKVRSAVPRRPVNKVR